MKILYCGDGPVEGAARYLTGILRMLHADVTHFLPKEPLTSRVLKKRYDAILLSDYPSSSASEPMQRLILEQCADGSGLAMIGGWASFTGLDGLWHGSAIEDALPVKILARDDRHNIAGGLLVTKMRNHPILRGVSFRTSPVICGLNEVIARKDSTLILEARPIRTEIQASGRVKISLARNRMPLLVTGRYHKGRTAAFATDLAPHWCGGLVDWGSAGKTLPVSPGNNIEVGDCYIHFVANLVKWLAAR